VCCLPVPVSLRQVTPGNARAIPINHSIDEQAIVGRCAADMAFAARQKILDLVPLVLAQSMAVHVSASP